MDFITVSVLCSLILTLAVCFECIVDARVREDKVVVALILILCCIPMVNFFVFAVFISHYIDVIFKD